jgi:hypothetical protein
MTPVEFFKPGTPTRDDPAVVEAMHVYDDILNDTERREVFQSIYRAVLAWKRTGRIDHLTGTVAEGLADMVLLEQQPGFTEARRTPTPDSLEPTEGIGIAEVIRPLREPR